MLALRELKAPTSLGYNDMAVMIAFGQFIVNKPVNAELISKYLASSRCVPGDAVMPSELVDSYLEMLANRALIAHNASDGYVMKHDVCDTLFTHYVDLKSPRVMDGFFHCFIPFFGNEMRGQRNLNARIAYNLESVFVPV